MTRPIPRRTWIGLLVMIVSETATLARIQPFYVWNTPIAWTGYILFADGVVWQRRGNSWLSHSRAELLFLTLSSIPLWLIFELYNLQAIRNWHYVGLPEPLPWRYSATPGRSRPSGQRFSKQESSFRRCAIETRPKAAPFLVIRESSACWSGFASPAVP